ncbi:hypothetical protein Rsub_06722 [Raphidocelis subcapitata]|uniref:Uncharacterized protein n=1 Tax=Raphidocelis subcapitata TaxID=307507 RepID=A0A2V0PBQ9_9CHLO|nr:hypothetical protein Rsub_06722 [Raphidocelis subcapitata]|eukprot:GBF94607.1 hypothetical protein Rsub_06722 [Raphidocelis subcapitata]
MGADGKQQQTAQTPLNYPPATGPSGTAYAAAPAPPGKAAEPSPTGPVAPMQVQGVPVAGARVPCACSAGWILFGLGFLFSPAWIVGAMLPLCHKGHVNDKRAAIACGVALATFVLLILIFVVIIPLSLDWYEEIATRPLAGAWQPTD